MAKKNVPGSVADLSALSRVPEQKAWAWYDWANSAYVTTVATVLFAPYLITVAEQAACGFIGDPDKNLKCTQDLSVFGLSIAPGALPSYIITFSTILSAVHLRFLSGSLMNPQAACSATVMRYGANSTVATVVT